MRKTAVATAMAHCLGDLSQFCHIMGAESHWGRENTSLHSNYEKVVDKTIKFQDRSSSSRKTVPGDACAAPGTKRRRLSEGTV